VAVTVPEVLGKLLCMDAAGDEGLPVQGEGVIPAGKGFLQIGHRKDSGLFNFSLFGKVFP